MIDRLCVYAVDRPWQYHHQQSNCVASTVVSLTCPVCRLIPGRSPVYYTEVDASCSVSVLWRRSSVYCCRRTGPGVSLLTPDTSKLWLVI